MSSPPGSPSPAASPSSQASNALTPTRKVQALLAQFDDSDSAPESNTNTSLPISISREPVLAAPAPENATTHLVNGDDSDDEDILPLAPRSRIAARLQGLNYPPVSTTVGAEDITAQADLPSETSNQAGNEDVVKKPGMRRRLLNKRKSSPVAAQARSDRTKSPSPLFFPSPTANSRDFASALGREPSDSEDGQDVAANGNSKFLALVAKHRKQRLEKEQEEAAKKAARIEALKSQEIEIVRHRGSSPADDTDEESDRSGNEGAKKLSTQARPARKASKKAIEEMNRETQRMSRNMQLTHQARVRKKITKESLLARFNYSTSFATSNSAAAALSSSRSNSRAGSETEGNNRGDTPPTSPLRDQADEHDKQVVTDTTILPIALGPQAGVLLTELEKGKARASIDDEDTSVSVLLEPENLAELQKPRATQKNPSIKALLLAQKLQSTNGIPSDDSDSDLEVITSRGDLRKYTAFEQLPKRKAKEAPSHLALRSLANLVGGEDRKLSMNAAEMEVALKKAARLQARQERDEKIAELRAKGVVIQTNEDRERDQQEVEDLHERARQAAAEIQKREKAAAKKEGNYVNDGLDDDEEDSDDEDFQEEENFDVSDNSEDEEISDEEVDENEDPQETHDELVDQEAGEADSEERSATEDEEDSGSQSETVPEVETIKTPIVARRQRMMRVLSDDDEDGGVKTAPQNNHTGPESPELPTSGKTPQSLMRSHRKQIPGLQMSDDLPIGLTQAFAATMADSQSQTYAEEQDSLEMTMDLPSPNIALAPRLSRLDSIDIITDSQPASQTQPLNLNLSFTQSIPIPQSPVIGLGIAGTQATPSQRQFEPTQDGDYRMSPFLGNRFSTDTPQQLHPHSTVETVALAVEVQESPILQRKSRLRRGRVDIGDSDEDPVEASKSAFEMMKRAARKSNGVFDKSKSRAREIIDEAAEESEDEYAGLGGASDEDVDEEENEQDREMIDENTQVGKGDEAKLARLFADRELEQDKAVVSKLFKDLTSGSLRRKRGNDDLDLSDEEDATVRRREAKRREFAKMRRELLKDEAVGKIAEDKKKEAFLRSIEDREAFSDDETGGFDEAEKLEVESQVEEPEIASMDADDHPDNPVKKLTSIKEHAKRPLATALPSKTNRMRRSETRPVNPASIKPTTLAEIRDSLSFLIEEHDSQSTTDPGFSDSEDEPEAYVNLDRHFREADADENADDGDDLGDFIVNDEEATKEDGTFKKPDAPYSETRAPYSERRTKERTNVVNRLTMLRQSSTSSSSNGSSRMAFHRSSSSANASFSSTHSLLRRATTNSSLGSISGRNENVSATGVVTNKIERGKASDEKDFVRKGNGGRRNAVNYRPTMKEEKMSQRAGVMKKTAAKNKKSTGGFLSGLFDKSASWA